MIVVGGGETLYRAAPRAEVTLAEARLTWPPGGHPAALDAAAAAILDCFAEPLSLGDLVTDVVAATGIDRATAVSAITALAARLLHSGHLVAEESRPAPPSEFWYPPTASP